MKRLGRRAILLALLGSAAPLGLNKALELRNHLTGHSTLPALLSDDSVEFEANSGHFSSGVSEVPASVPKPVQGVAAIEEGVGHGL